MEIELRHLRLVRAVADASSVTRAASALGSSQPALTRSLRRIEEALGGPLFERSRHGVEPTALGKLVVARARAILPAVESLQADVELARLASGDGPGQVRLGACVGATMMGFVQGMSAVAPDATVTSESETRIGELVDLALAGRVDIAAVHEFAGHELSLNPDLERHAMTTQPVFVMLAEDHPLATRREVELADLADELWVLKPLDVDHEYDVLAAACDEVGFTPKVEHYLTGGPAVEFVRSAGRVGLCYPIARFSGVVTRPLVGSPLRVRHVAVHHRRSPLAPFAAQLVRYAVDEIDTVAAAVPTYRDWLERHGRLATGALASVPLTDSADPDDPDD